MSGHLAPPWSVEASDHPLPIALAAAVPLRILELRRKGGPDAADWERAQAAAGLVAERGDVLLFGGRPGEAARLFIELAHAIACLAFVPGGLSIGRPFGLANDESDG